MNDDVLASIEAVSRMLKAASYRQPEVMHIHPADYLTLKGIKVRSHRKKRMKKKFFRQAWARTGMAWA